MNYTGVILGIGSLLIIGIWHPIVIKGEYYFGKKICAVAFAVIGTVSVILSLFTKNLIASALIALFGFSGFWGIQEVFEQEKRVSRGWFPKRNKDSDNLQDKNRS